METEIHSARKWGIGVVSWAHGHVNAYAGQIKNFEDAQLIACWDDDVERGRKNAETFGMAFEADLQTLLARSGYRLRDRGERNQQTRRSVRGRI